MPQLLLWFTYGILAFYQNLVPFIYHGTGLNELVVSAQITVDLNHNSRYSAG